MIDKFLFIRLHLFINLNPIRKYCFISVKISPNYDTDGNYLRAFNFGGAISDEGFDVFVDSDENIYLTGYFSNAVDFDMGLDTALLIGGNADIFMAKYSKAVPLVIQKPYNNSTWLVGADYPIDWYGYGIDSVKIERQQSGQSSWEFIAIVAAGESPYSYNLPSNNPLDTYKIRVSDLFNKTVKSGF